MVLNAIPSDTPVVICLQDYALPQDRYITERFFLLNRPIVRSISPYHEESKKQLGINSDAYERIKKDLQFPNFAFNKIICVSERIAEYASTLGYKDSKIDVILNGVDDDWFEDKALDEKLNSLRKIDSFVSVGRIERHKGVHVLCEAFMHTLAEYPSIQLELYGDGDEQYIAELKNRYISENILFKGKISREEVRKALIAADLSVIPSIYAEPFGLVALESTASGCVTIASNIGGLG